MPIETQYVVVKQYPPGDERWSKHGRQLAFWDTEAAARQDLQEVLVKRAFSAYGEKREGTTGDGSTFVIRKRTLIIGEWEDLPLDESFED